MKKTLICLFISASYSAALPKREIPNQPHGNDHPWIGRSRTFDENDSLATNQQNDHPWIERSGAFDEDDEIINPLQEVPTNQGNLIHDLESISETDHELTGLQYLWGVFYSFVIRRLQQARSGAGSDGARPIASEGTPANLNSVFRLE